MNRSKEILRMLPAAPNPHQDGVEAVTLEDRVVQKAAACLTIGGLVAIYEVEHSLPELDPEEIVDQSFDIALNRLETNDYVIGDYIYAFDQIMIVGNDDDDGITTIEQKGAFALIIAEVDGANVDQYMFRLLGTQPFMGEVYSGFDGISKETRVDNRKHLKALDRFLDRLHVVMLADCAQVINQYPIVAAPDPEIVVLPDAE